MNRMPGPADSEPSKLSGADASGGAELRHPPIMQPPLTQPPLTQPPLTPPPIMQPPLTQPPSPDVAGVSAESTLPGVHRGGFSRLPTAPVGTVSAETPAPELRWVMPEPAAPARGMGAWALFFSLSGLVVSLFVGWGFPLGIAGIVAAVVALRRPLESRPLAVGAIVLSAVSLAYSAGWLSWAWPQLGIVP